MTSVLKVLSPGLQTTIQAGPRRGHRHLGVPACGAADIVSLALANALVGNAWDAPGLEIALAGARFEALASACVAVTGAPCEVALGGTPASHHDALWLRAGEVLEVGPARLGCRTYLAVAGGFVGEEAFGSTSTYLPAGFGGLSGRALREGDRLHGAPGRDASPGTETPPALRAPFTRSWTLRATVGPEADVFGRDTIAPLFGEGWHASRAADRTGIRLDGPALPRSGDAGMDSVAVLPGTVQLPPGGAPILLGVDGGTTGGYPRAAQVIRADRHLLGQVRPGDAVRLLRWKAADAVRVLAQKEAMLRAHVGSAFRL